MRCLPQTLKGTLCYSLSIVPNWPDREALMTPLVQGWSSAALSCGGPAPPWDRVPDSSSIVEPTLNDALDWSPLPSWQASGFVSVLMHDEISAQTHPQGGKLGAAWNIPSISALESATSAPDSQAGPDTSDLANPSEGSKQAGSTQSRYTTERKLIKNREAQRRFRQRHKVGLYSLHVPGLQFMAVL